MKIWFIIATVLVLLGLLFFAAIMTATSWDFQKLSTASYETNTHLLTEDFHDLLLETNTANICLSLAEDGLPRVECYEKTNAKHTVSIENGRLSIRLSHTKKWYEYISINFETPKITVYLPKDEYDTLSLKASTGNISVSNITAASLSLAVSTGKVTASKLNLQGELKLHVSTGRSFLTDVTCQRLVSDGNTGDITLKNVIASERIEIERTTGDVTLDACDAAELDIETDTGAVTGSLLSE